MAAAHIPAQGNNEQTEDHTGRQDHIAQDGKVWVLDQSEKIKGKGKQHQGDTDGGDGDPQQSQRSVPHITEKLYPVVLFLSAVAALVVVLQFAHILLPCL